MAGAKAFVLLYLKFASPPRYASREPGTAGIRLCFLIPENTKAVGRAMRIPPRNGGKMDLLTLFLLAVGLSMDAFAVSVCKGLAMNKITVRQAAVVGLWFGGFQAGMPTVGFLLGRAFASYVNAVADWIAFILLVFIGANMIREALSGKEEAADASLAPGKMLVLAIATSIDAFAVGVSFAFMEIGGLIIPAVLFIGVTTFALSVAGVKAGNVFGARYKARAELAGGIILVLLGIKIIVEHYL